LNKILLELTKFVIFSNNGKFVRTQNVKIPNCDEREVAVFSGDTLFLGQCTPFGTVIINESVLNDERLSNYVLVHEFAHTGQWWFYFSIPLALLFILSIYPFLLAVIFLIQSISSMNGTYLVEFMFWLIIAIFAVGIPCLYSWVLELNAEFAVIRYLGLQSFKEIRKDLRQTRKLSIGSRIIRRLTHPSDGITVSVWLWFHEPK
jgi:hypothetical protein